jgi:hypothetical protein
MTKHGIKQSLPSVAEMGNDIKNFILKASEKELENFFEQIHINITKYPLSYSDTKISFQKYIQDNPFYYKGLTYCFAHIVKYYDRTKPEKMNLLTKIILKLQDFQKYTFLTQ